jgi:hypothetical protein
MTKQRSTWGRATGWLGTHPKATLVLIGFVAVTVLAFLEWSTGLGHILSLQDCPVPMPNGQMPPEAASFCHP